MAFVLEAGDLVANPLQDATYNKINSAMTLDIAYFFKSTQRVVVDGIHKNTSAVHVIGSWHALRSPLAMQLYRLKLAAARQAAGSVGMHLLQAQEAKFLLQSGHRAEAVVQLMRQTTLERLAPLMGAARKDSNKPSVLEIAQAPNFLGIERASKIANYESRKSWLSGVILGWGLNKSYGKAWYVSDAHDTDDTCDDNQDDGVIAVSEAFTSGDFEPPAHLHCECYLIGRRLN